MSRLTGLGIVVTGAANGIGRATALALVREGARLVLDDIDVAGLERLRAQIGDGARVTTVCADVRVMDEMRDLARYALLACGRVDAVVNCAGVIATGPVDTCPPADIECQLDTNLLGSINVARAFLPHLRRQRSGHLLFVASLAGMVPLPGESIYAASKFAVRGFAMSLALELRGTGISVTDLCPDSVRTRMLEIEAVEDGSSLSFASEAMEPEQVAQAIMRTLTRPRREVTVPVARGWVIRLLGALPILHRPLYPLMDAMGRKRKARYAAALKREAAAREVSVTAVGD